MQQRECQRTGTGNLPVTLPASYPQISRAPRLDRSTGTFDKGKQQIAAEDVVSC
jgi:hypothetical protein